MFRNYFKIAVRNLVRNRSYSLINIAGLTTGIAVCMIIFVIIQFQTSFDNFHPQKDRIFRVLTEVHQADAATVSYGKEVPFPLPGVIQSALPGIEKVAPVWESHNDQLLIPGESGAAPKAFKEDRGIFFTTPSFFSIFSYPLLAGSAESLRDPNNVLLTRETAEKYFGDWRLAIGRTIKLEAGGNIFSHAIDLLKVTGILAPIPANTDFQLKMVVAFGTGITEDMAKNTDWADRKNTGYGCYLLLPPNTGSDQFNQQLRSFARKFETAENKDSCLIQPLAEVHYDIQAGNYSGKTISRQLLRGLWLIAAFILLIACVNFINLSTAQAVNRAKEIGVRKVLGSRKTQLQSQFITETFLIVLLALALAALITVLALPAVGKLLELSLSVRALTTLPFALFLLGLLVVVTGLAGFYPSLILARFNPIHALKSKLTAASVKGISLRRGLVMFQFVVAQALIIGTLVIVRQMDFFTSQPLGFDQSAVVNVPFRVDSLRISRLDYLRNKLLSVNGVQEVSFSSNTPVEDADDMWSSLKFDHAQKESGFKAITKFADDQYLAAYKLQLVAGRNLQPSPYTREFLVNESLVRSLGIRNPEDMLNKEISIWDGLINCPVVGVVKDFNDRSFRHGLAPLLISTNVTMYSQAGIKLATKDMAATLQSVRSVWEEVFPNFVYEYRFLDEKIQGFYRQESQLGILYRIFAAIAVLLSCLGLYGLASFMAVQRIKEVGIRKVLGANPGNIIYLFSKELILLIIVAFAIATPLAWYYMNQWLQDYVYRINIPWWIFGAGGFAALGIALATISVQAIRAAVSNPVKSLRSE